MTESTTNRRRHAPDLKISDKDLVTGRDCRRIVEEAWVTLASVVEESIASAIADERERVKQNAWWRRALRTVRA